MAASTKEKKGERKNGIKRLVFIALSMLLEIVAMTAVFTSIGTSTEWINITVNFAAFVTVLIIYSQHRTSAVKVPWIMLIMVFPVFGLSMFLLNGLNRPTKALRERFSEMRQRYKSLFPPADGSLESLGAVSKTAVPVASYLEKCIGFKLYSDTDIKYYADTGDIYEAMIEALESAEKYIFMEYFTIEDASSWQRIQDILVRKLSEGVEVRVFYDDVGSIKFIDNDFAKSLRALGIKCRIFNPFAPGLNMLLNCRDHRKITVVDGKVAFTGGFNIAEEYFNITSPYGKWKDAGVRIKGRAALSFTGMFLNMWIATSKKSVSEYEDSDITERYFDVPDSGETGGSFVQPYADSPIDDERIGEEVYISMINSAREKCWFMTPYLIITDEMLHALCLAAKRGVDVRIITPGIPDKKMVYNLTRSFYPALSEKGVRIFEWTPGFCHSKVCMVDSETAAVGSINLDYRSLYHSFEDGVFIAGGDIIKDIEDDFLATFGECREIDPEFLADRSIPTRIWQMVLRLFAELL